MTNELQNSDVFAEDLTQSQETENLEQEQGAELATDSETQHEEKAEADSEEFINQEAVQKKIGKKHFAMMQERREKEKLQKQLDDIRRKEQEAQAQKFSEMPAEPDPFDENYDSKMAEYKDALSAKAKFDAHQELLQQQQLQQQQLEQAQRSQELQKKADEYTNRAKSLGVNQNDMAVIGQKLAEAGMNEQLALAVLDDPEGPLIAKYLSTNLAELDALQSENPYLAGAKMVEIKEKAMALKPKTSNAPAPATKVEQQAVDPEAGMLKHAKGGRFE